MFSEFRTKLNIFDGAFMGKQLMARSKNDFAKTLPHNILSGF